MPLPKVRATRAPEGKEFQGFPLDHYSYSSFVSFSSNPLMFKVRWVNGDQLDTTTSASTVLGKALHKAVEAYLGGGDVPCPADEAGAIKHGHDTGLEYLKAYSDGLIEWKSTIPNRSKLEERYAFAYFGYIRDLNFKGEETEIVAVEHGMKHKVEVDGKTLPVPLKGYADMIYRDKRTGTLHIRDHKFTSKHSDPDAIDAQKLLEAAFHYFLVAAEYGEAPASIIFSEFKVTENRDKTAPQTREFEIVYKDAPLLFDLFFRMYEDVTAALLGKQVFIPNVQALFDREVAILAYIHRLDIDEERAKALAKMKVDNVTDFLKKRIQKDGAMAKYLETVQSKFVSHETLNYKDMTTEEKIKMKLAEHGIGLEFDSKVAGSAVTLYRYEPSIGLKMSRIEKYARDIEQVVGKAGVRVLAPIPDTQLVGFEIPRRDRQFPGAAPKAKGMSIPVGVNIAGETRWLDLREAPHMLVAGATGSGKSVFLTQIIRQIAQMPVSRAQMVLLDPKLVELPEFAEERNTRAYESDIEKIHAELKSLVAEMQARYQNMREKGAKTLEEYRKKGGKTPYLFVFIDEFGDLIVQNYVAETETDTGEEYQSGPRKGQPKTVRERRNISKDIRTNVLLLAQKARAAGIHIVLTTQRPSHKIVDGAIKANFPTRAAFRTSSEVDSAVIIDTAGAEKLTGKGDMLLLRADGSGIERLQGFYDDAKA